MHPQSLCVGSFLVEELGKHTNYVARADDDLVVAPMGESCFKNHGRSVQVCASVGEV